MVHLCRFERKSTSIIRKCVGKTASREKPSMDANQRISSKTTCHAVLRQEGWVQLEALKGRECSQGSGRKCPSHIQKQGQSFHRSQPSLIECIQPKKRRIESLKSHIDSNTRQTGKSPGSGIGREENWASSPTDTFARAGRLLVKAH